MGALTAQADVNLAPPPASGRTRHGRLARELAWVVALKLVLIMFLWWAFVRDARVPVDPGRMAAHTQAMTTAVTADMKKESSNGH